MPKVAQFELAIRRQLASLAIDIEADPVTLLAVRLLAAELSRGNPARILHAKRHLLRQSPLTDCTVCLPKLIAGLLDLAIREARLRQAVAA